MNLYIYVNQTSILDIKIITGIPNIPNDFMAGTHKIKIKHEPRKLTNVTKPGLFIDKKKDLTIGLTGFLGLFLLSVISYFTHIFTSHHYIHNSLFFINSVNVISLGFNVW